MDTSQTSVASVARRKKSRHSSNPRKPELRHLTIGSLEVRSKGESSDTITIAGSPIIYDTAYAVYDMFGEFEETIARGAAAGVVNGDTRFLFNHDGMPLARTIAGTMTLEDQDDGLHFEAQLDSRQQLAKDLSYAIERGDVGEMSVGMVVGADEWDEDYEHRTIYRISELLDVSAVSFAASPTTHIQVLERMAENLPEEVRARIEKVYVDLRAGKLDTNRITMVTDAVTALHEVIERAAEKPEAVEPEAEVTEVTEVTEMAEVTEAGEETRVTSVSARTKLDLELELLRLRRH